MSRYHALIQQAGARAGSAGRCVTGCEPGGLAMEMAHGRQGCLHTCHDGRLGALERHEPEVCICPQCGYEESSSEAFGDGLQCPVCGFVLEHFRPHV